MKDIKIRPNTDLENTIISLVFLTIIGALIYVIVKLRKRIKNKRSGK